MGSAIGQHTTRGMRAHIEQEQYASLGQNSSPLRQSMPTAHNPLSERDQESFLRQRRQPGHPSEDEITGSAAATIMTSVSAPLLFSLTVHVLRPQSMIKQSLA